MMWRRGLVGFLALVLAALPIVAASAQGLEVGCGDVEGAWDWPIGGVVTLAPDGDAGWAPEVGMAAAFAGEWSCDRTDGHVVIVWQQGLTDRLRLDFQSGELRGENDVGVAIVAARHGAQGTPEVAPAGPVPPMLVGSWLLEVMLPSPQGPVAVLWTIEADGSYRIEAGPYSHSGTMTAFNGTWEQAATDRVFTDGGRYLFPNWARLETPARSGHGRWRRIMPELTLSTMEVSGQQVPTDLPALVERARTVAWSWRPDAELRVLDFDRPDSNQSGASLEVDLGFVSPATGAGLSVTVATDGTRFFAHDVVTWGSDPIPDGFLDLPVVWAIGRQHGLQPPLDRAGLKVWRPGDGEPVLAWGLSAARGEPRGLNIDGVTGGKLDGDLSGYVAQYNAQWEAAVAGLRRLFARPAPRSSGSSSSDFSWGDSSSSNSSDDDSGSGSSSGYDTASQNSWSAGDMPAYDRIQSGTPTGDDCYRYGC